MFELFDEVKRLTVIKSPLFVPEIKLYSIQPFAIKYPYKVDDFNAMYGYPTWACISLSRFILDNPDLLKDKVVVDIGCGSGVAGIAAAKIGAKVKSIDKDIASLYFTEQNAKLNDVQLDIIWGNFNDALKYETIIMSSLFYEPRNKNGIIQTLENKKVIIGSYQNSVENHLEKKYIDKFTKVKVNNSKDFCVYHNFV